MDIKKLLICGFVAGILYFLLGWLLYGNLLMSFFYHNAGRKGHLGRLDMNLPYIFAGNLLQGFLLSFILIKAKTASLAEGLVTAAIVGFLMVAGADTVTYATTFILSKRAIAGDIAAFTIMSAIVGAVVGIIISKPKT